METDEGHGSVPTQVTLLILSRSEVVAMARESWRHDKAEKMVTPRWEPWMCGVIFCSCQPRILIRCMYLKTADVRNPLQMEIRIMQRRSTSRRDTEGDIVHRRCRKHFSLNLGLYV